MIQRYILNLFALMLEIVGAYLAAPVAIEMKGLLPGLALTAAIAMSIFASWYIAINGRTHWLARLSIGLMAMGLLLLSAYSINLAGQMDAIKASKAAHKAELAKIEERYQQALIRYQAKAKEVDEAHKLAVERRNAQVDEIMDVHHQQERSRMESLARVNAEIKMTMKEKQPDIYSALLNQQASLMTPTVSATLPPMPEMEVLPPVPQREPSPTQTEVYEFTMAELLQASAITFLVPVLLLLGKLSGDGKTQKWSLQMIMGLFNSRRADRQTDRSDQVINYIPAPEAGKTEMDAVISRLIPEAADGAVTVENIRQSLGISDRQARKLQQKSVTLGHMERRNNRYYYLQKRNSIRQKAFDRKNVVQINRSTG